MWQVSYVKALDIFLLPSFAFIFAAMIELIVVLNTNTNFREPSSKPLLERTKKEENYLENGNESENVCKFERDNAGKNNRKTNSFIGGLKNENNNKIGSEIELNNIKGKEKTAETNEKHRDDIELDSTHEYIDIAKESVTGFVKAGNHDYSNDGSGTGDYDQDIENDAAVADYDNVGHDLNDNRNDSNDDGGCHGDHDDGSHCDDEGCSSNDDDGCHSDDFGCHNNDDGCHGDDVGCRGDDEGCRDDDEGSHNDDARNHFNDDDREGYDYDCKDRIDDNNYKELDERVKESVGDRYEGRNDDKRARAQNQISCNMKDERKPTQVESNAKGVST